jgi:hypothetical protein
MNLDPPIAFDPSEELSNFGDSSQEHYGLSERVYFYLIVTARHIESFAGPAFTIEAVFGPPKLTPAGCVVEFVVHHGFWIDVSAQRLKLWALQADQAGDASGSRWLVFEGNATNPTSWQSLLQAVGRVEGFYVVGAHADRLRQMHTQWLAARRRRDDERGF